MKPMALAARAERWLPTARGPWDKRARGASDKKSTAASGGGGGDAAVRKRGTAAGGEVEGNPPPCKEYETGVLLGLSVAASSE